MRGFWCCFVASRVFGGDSRQTIQHAHMLQLPTPDVSPPSPPRPALSCHSTVGPLAGGWQAAPATPSAAAPSSDNSRDGCVAISVMAARMQARDHGPWDLRAGAETPHAAVSVTSSYAVCFDAAMRPGEAGKQHAKRVALGMQLPSELLQHATSGGAAAASAPAVALVVHAEQRVAGVEYSWDSVSILAPGESIIMHALQRMHAGTLPCGLLLVGARRRSTNNSQNLCVVYPQHQAGSKFVAVSIDRPHRGRELPAPATPPPVQQPSPTATQPPVQVAAAPVHQDPAAIADNNLTESNSAEASQQHKLPHQGARAKSSSGSGGGSAVCGVVGDGAAGGWWATAQQAAASCAAACAPLPAQCGFARAREVDGGQAGRPPAASWISGAVNAVLSAALLAALLIRRQQRTPSPLAAVATEPRPGSLRQQADREQPLLGDNQPSDSVPPVLEQLQLRAQMCHEAAPVPAAIEEEEDFFPFGGYGVSSKPAAAPTAAAALGGGARGTSAAAPSGGRGAGAGGAAGWQDSAAAPAVLGPQLAGGWQDGFPDEQQHPSLAGAADAAAASPGAWLTASARKAGRWTRDVAGRLIRASRLAAMEAAGRGEGPQHWDGGEGGEGGGDGAAALDGA
jgi:hypothetical protein